MSASSHGQSRRVRLLRTAGLPILVVLLACAPDTPSTWEPDYWLILEYEQGSPQYQPPWVRRSVPVPVVRSLGIDVSRLNPPRSGRIHLLGGDASVPIVAGQDRYVFDVTVGFRGFEPYQWAAVIIEHPDRRGRYWQTLLRVVPGFEADAR